MIVEFKVGFARTINLGNYESMRVEAQITVAVKPEDDLAVLQTQVQTDLKNLLRETYLAQKKGTTNERA